MKYLFGTVVLAVVSERAHDLLFAGAIFVLAIMVLRFAAVRSRR